MSDALRIVETLLTEPTENEGRPPLPAPGLDNVSQEPTKGKGSVKRVLSDCDLEFF